MSENERPAADAPEQAAGETYAGWLLKYASLFAMSDARDAEMMQNWIADIFIPQEYSPEDLRRATLAMAAQDAPRHRGEHLSKLMTFLREGRREKAEAVARQNLAGQPDVSFAVCPDCVGTGRASVPNPDKVKAGDWNPDAGCWSVLCECPLGVARRLDQYPYKGKKEFQMRLSEYENTLPDWRNLVKLRRQQLLWEHGAKVMTQKLDRAMGPLPKVKRGGKPKEGKEVIDEVIGARKTKKTDGV